MVDRKTILSPKFELKGKFLEIFFLAPSLGLKKELSVLISVKKEAEPLNEAA